MEITSKMSRQIIFAFSFLSLVLAQNVVQLSRSLKEQKEVWTSAIQRNHSHLVLLSETNTIFSLDDFLDVVNEARGDFLSDDCNEDMGALISARLGHFDYPEFAKEVWMTVRDSAGRIGPAILKGHINFAGHYSECVQINAHLTGRERPFATDYFRVDVDLLLQPHSNNESCSSAVWSFGICLPASCSSEELENLFTADLPPTSTINKRTIPETAKHNPVCRIHRTNDAIPKLGTGFYVTISIMGVVFGLCLLSGVADFFFTDYLNDKRFAKSFLWRLFMCFSLYTNVGGIFDTSESRKDGQIAPIHCIRFFSMCWVVLGHLSTTIPGVVANPLNILDLTKDLTTEFIFNAFFSVDSFFFIGGLLLTFLWFKNYYRNPELANSPRSWIMFYVHRILRLSPPYYMMVLFFAFVFKQFYRNSPMNITLETQTDACQETWWLDFTYLHNIIDNDDQCVGYTWYLSTDTQMFFFSPLIILPLALKPLIGLIVATAFFIISSAINILLVYHYHWPATPNFLGALDPDVTGSENYEVYMYYSPVTRCQVYIIGMLVGWFLQTKKRMRVHPIINFTLWIITLALMLTLILGLHSQTTGEIIPIFWRAMYSAFSKPAWALALSWIIISCYYGYGGPINSFMSWHIWVPLGRLSYCGYLFHFPIIFIVLVQSHDEFYFSSFTDFTITRLIPIIGVIYFVSIFWSACFEISFGKLEMLLLGGFCSKVNNVEPVLRQRKPSKSEVFDEEDAHSFKMRL